MYFNRNLTRPVLACGPLPYVILKGKINWDIHEGGISCRQCSVHTCINPSVRLPEGERCCFLRARVGAWIPVTLSRPSEENPTREWFANYLFVFPNRPRDSWGCLLLQSRDHCSDSDDGRGQCSPEARNTDSRIQLLKNQLTLNCRLK